MNAKIQYAENGKRDLHGLENEYDKALQELDAEEWKHPTNRDIIKHYLKECKKGAVKTGGRNKRIGKSTLYRVLGILRLLSESWLDKPFEDAKPEDWERFYENMEEDKILNEYGQKFKPSSKSKNYKTVKKFLKWRFGNNQSYPAFCENWVTTEAQTSKEHLTREEVEKLVTGASQIQTKAFIMMSWDGGFRIEELTNLRWCDLIRNKDKNYYQAHIRPETSKTKTERFVSLNFSTELIDIYRASMMQKKAEAKEVFSEKDYLFPTTYGNLYKNTRRLGLMFLNKKISPHTFRHSSATYYADIIETYQAFCARYGWNLRSSSPQRYFHKRGDANVADSVQESEVLRYKHEMERLKLTNSMQSSKNEELRKDLEELKKVQQTMEKTLLDLFDAKYGRKAKGIMKALDKES